MGNTSVTRSTHPLGAAVIHPPLDTTHEWTGRLPMELMTPRDRVISATMEAKISRDTVQFWFDERCVAAIDRAAFREWFTTPGPQHFIIDDVRWSHHDGVVWVNIHRTLTYGISEITFTSLLAVI